VRSSKSGGQRSVELAAHQAHMSSLLSKSRHSDVRGGKCVRRAINFNNFGNNFGKFRNGKNHGDDKSREGSDDSDNDTREDARADGGFGEFVSDNRYPFNSAEYFEVHVARVGDDGSVMLTKTNPGPSSATSATLNPKAEWSSTSATSRMQDFGSSAANSVKEEESQRTGEDHPQAVWSLGHQVNAASVSSEADSGRDDSRALILWTAGDALQILLTQQQRRRHRELTSSLESRSVDKSDNENGSLGLSAVASCGRPYALSLVLATLKGFSGAVGQDMILKRAAIVDIERSIFKARLFFGLENRPDVSFDIDCRPSDALCLSHATNCPVYVSKAVWSSHAMTVDRAFDSSEGLRSRARQDLDATLELTGDIVRDIQPSDPEAVKFLKRCLQVALAEEDYAGAAKIRDHPFMLMQVQIKEALENEDVLEANRLAAQLREMIRKIDDGHQP